MTVAILRRDSPFGVLGVFTAQARQFSAHDVHFLEPVAKTLGPALKHQAALDALWSAR